MTTVFEKPEMRDELGKIQVRLKPLGFNSEDTDHLMEVEDMFDEAMGLVKSHCKRDDLTTNMLIAIRKLVRIAWLRRGTEGESSRSESGISQTFEVGIPEDIVKLLASDRKLTARVRRF